MVFSLSAGRPYYVCVNCGNPDNPAVIKVFGNHGNKSSDLPSTHLKLAECTVCRSSVDEYVQLDNCILIINGILQKTSFYRHILLNCELPMKLVLRLAVVFGLCDAYRNWSQKSKSVEDSYMELEFSFYFTFAKSLLETIILYLMIYSFFRIFAFKTNFKSFMTSLVICSYSKLFNVFSVLYASELRPFVEIILDIFQIISLAQCLRVISKIKVNVITAFSIVCAAYFLKTIISRSIDIYLIK